MELLRNNKAIIVWCISLVLILLPIAQSLACNSTYAVDLSSAEDSVKKDSLHSTAAPKYPSCHTVEKSSNRGHNDQLSPSVSGCDGDCCNYCMITYITNTSSIIDIKHDSFFHQVSIFHLKPDFLSMPALPPPIV